MNPIQKAVRWTLEKALGFPPMDVSNHGLGRYFMTGGSTAAGITVSPTNSLALAAVYGCARVWCNTLASVPLNVFREGSAGREKATSHPLYYLLHDQPNALMTSFEWREAMVLGLALWGNSYSYIAKLGGIPRSLNPMRPDWVTVVYDEKGLRYEYHGINGVTRTYQPEEVLHLRNFSLDGIHGLSPLGVAREVIGKGLALQQYSSSFFRNGGRPGGVLEHPGKLGVDAVKRLRSEWREVHAGSENAGETAILYEGMKYAPIGVPPEDAQFVETAKLNTADIACLYGVPLNKLAQSDKSATYASAEQFSLDFVKDTVRPLAVRFEQAINKSLVGPRSDVFAEFDLEGLLRGDAASRGTYYNFLLQNGVVNRNLVARKENFPELGPEGEIYTVQSNMIDLSKLPDMVPGPAPASSPAAVPAKDNPSVVFAPQIEVEHKLDAEHSAEVIRETVGALERSARGRKKIITLRRDEDGLVTGADAVEVIQ